MAYDYDKLKKMELYQVGSGAEPYAIADRKAREGLVEAQEDIEEILEDIADLQEEDVKLKNDLVELESYWNNCSNLIDNKIEIIKYKQTDADNTITCTVDDNGCYVINGTCNASVYVALTNEELERFPNGTYVFLSDNKQSDINSKNIRLAFIRYGHNNYGIYRYNACAYKQLTYMTNRLEVSLTREDISGFTYDRDGVRLALMINSGTYDDYKFRVWAVKNGDDEGYSKFGLADLKDYCKLADLKDYCKKSTIELKSDHNIRFAVATDIHWNHDDTATTGLNGDQKTQLLVDAINTEHHKIPLDFLLITGDINNDNINDATNDFIKKFLWQFEMPVVLFAGNHDPLSNWSELTGYNRRTSLETDDFYIIWEDTFGDNLGKTWLSHWSAYYQSGDAQAYIPCKSTDSGALLVGTNIKVADVTPLMRGWSYAPKNGDYVKLAYAKDCDMYKAPSLSYVQSEVAKAGDKKIIFACHQIISASDGDTNGVKEYLKSLPNFLFFLEGHAHIYFDSKDTASNTWTLNSGHFFVPSEGWEKVASNNYRGFRIIEEKDNQLITYKVQPTQNVGSPYEHQYDIVNEKVLFNINKNPRAEIDLRKLKKDRDFSKKIKDIEKRLSALENS